MAMETAAQPEGQLVLSVFDRDFGKEVDGTDICGKFLQPEDARPLVAHNRFSKEIAVIDLAQEREQVVAAVGKASKEWGIFQIINHAVPEPVIRRLQEEVAHFFALPMEEKLKYREESGSFVGYNKGSFLRDDEILDWRELIAHWCLPPARRKTCTWPDKPAGYRHAVADYSRHMSALITTLLEIIAESLHLPATTFNDMFQDGSTEQKLLFNFYPACPQPNLTLGLKRHTDPGLLTILLQDSVGGLQATKDGKTWVTVEPVEGALVVNLGDQMQVLTNGLHRSADHRAVVDPLHSRASTVCFLMPAPATLIAPLRELVHLHTRPPISEPYLFQDFYQMKMRSHQKKAVNGRNTVPTSS